MRVETTLNIDKDILEKTEMYMKEEGYSSLSFVIEQYLKSICNWYPGLSDSEDMTSKVIIETERERVTELRENLKNAEAALAALEAEALVENI